MRKKNNLSQVRKAIAVIGEGITEREYFKSLKNHEKLPFKFKPDIPKHSDIWSIASKAEELANSFDCVYCIVDLDRIIVNKQEYGFYRKIKNRQKNIIYIETNPCFELWILLHFEFSTRDYDNCGSLVGILRKYIPDYSKSLKYLECKDLYGFLYSKLDLAIKHSILLEKAIVNSKCDVYKLIGEMNIKKL
jgi:hypothetical protein